MVLDRDGEDHFDSLCVKIVGVLHGVKKPGTFFAQRNEGRLNGLLTSCLGTAFENALFKERRKGREDEGKDVSIYWLTLTNQINRIRTTSSCSSKIHSILGYQNNTVFLKNLRLGLRNFGLKFETDKRKRRH
jgi:hypothetical protein